MEKTENKTATGMKVSEAAEYAGVSRETIYNQIETGLLRTLRRSPRGTLVCPESVQKYKEAREAPDLISVAEAARLLDINLMKAHRWVRQGRLEAAVTEPVIRIHPRAVEAARKRLEETESENVPSSLPEGVTEEDVLSLKEFADAVGTSVPRVRYAMRMGDLVPVAKAPYRLLKRDVEVFRDAEVKKGKRNRLVQIQPVAKASKLLLTIQEAADRGRVGTGVIYPAMYRGELVPVEVEPVVRFAVEDIDAFLKRYATRKPGKVTPIQLPEHTRTCVASFDLTEPRSRTLLEREVQTLLGAGTQARLLNLIPGEEHPRAVMAITTPAALPSERIIHLLRERSTGYARNPKIEWST